MKTKNHGFTLVELLIAIVISLVGVLAASEVYISTRQTNRLQGMQSRLSEDGRFAVSMLQRFLSQAGFRVSPSTALSTDRIGVTKDGTDAVITVKFKPDGVNQIACNGSVAPANTADQTFVIRRTGNSLLCDGVGWIAPAAAGAGNGTELVDFAVSAGVDTGPAGTAEDFGCGVAAPGGKPRDCIADKYVSALTAGTETVDQITAVRVCMVLRSEATDSSVVKPANVADCAGAAIANTQNDRRLYRTFWTTVLMKNR
jgi:type IV pilus assembly protein PilW